MAACTWIPVEAQFLWLLTFTQMPSLLQLICLLWELLKALSNNSSDMADWFTPVAHVYLSDLSSECREWKGDTTLSRLDWAWRHNSTAKSCGLWGFTILHSLLRKETEQGEKITSYYVERETPTYYGMMSVFFDKVPKWQFSCTSFLH